MTNSPHSISHDCFPCMVTNTVKHLSDSCLCAHFSHCCGVFLGDYFFQSHQLSSDGEAGAVLFGQFDFDSFGALDRLQGSGQVLWSHLQTDLIGLGGHALHLVLIKEVSLQGDQ